MILRCTKKLLTVIRPQQLAGCPPDGEDWYANLLWLSGRKCLLLSHAATLFTVFEADVRAAGLRDPGCLVTGLISRELLREELPADTFGSPAVAVGTALAGGPPRRSQRAELPHWAPTMGGWRRSAARGTDA